MARRIRLNAAIIMVAVESGFPWVLGSGVADSPQEDEAMSEAKSTFARTSLLLVFAYASAGLGHLRVTDALYHGLPPLQSSPIVLRSPDQSIAYLHRLTSSHPALRSVMEWLQTGLPEDLFTSAYRWFLRSRTRLLREHLESLLDGLWLQPDTIVVVATHFGLAHQLAAIKQPLSQARQARILLVVQVTDDSPQHIWYVSGADLIVVPSDRTREALLAYGQTMGLPPLRIEVLPYPASPLLSKPLTADEIHERHRQLLPEDHADIQVVFPVSGAAIGLAFFERLVDALHGKSSRFQFHVVAKSSGHTRPFLSEMQKRSFVTLHTANTDRETVEAYERVYQDTVVTLEIIKPSEQAFKALMDPTERGGSLLLLSQPIGRQEYDNLSFLDRHGLIPAERDQRILWDRATAGGPLEPNEAPIIDRASAWRGVRLPNDPEAAAEAIWWCLEHRVFAQMLQCRPALRHNDPQVHELQQSGVHAFWDRVSQLVNSR